MLTIFLPKSVSDLLPTTYQFKSNNPKAKYHLDVALLLLWQVQRRCLSKGWERFDNQTTLNSRNLKHIDRYYYLYFDLFEQLGILNTNHSYQPGKQSKQYRIVSSPDDKVYYHQITRKTTLNKVTRILSNSGRAYLTSEQQIRKEHLKSFRVDISKVTTYLDTTDYKPIHKAWFLYNCSLINDGQAYLFKDLYGREHTPFTNMPSYIRDNYVSLYTSQREEREFLSLCGALFEIDIPTSQPRFLISWLENKKIDPIEYSQYKADVLTKDFYTHFVQHYNHMYNTNKTRNDVKKPLLSTMYGKPHWVNKYTTCYQSLYPTIYQAMCEFKTGPSDQYKKLAHQMQRLEAEFMFGFCEQLEQPYFTVHDAIYLAASQGPLVRSRFELELAQEIGQ